MRSPFLTLAAAAALTSVACTAKNAANKPDTTSPATATTTSSANDAATVRPAIDSANARFDSALDAGDTATLLGLYGDDAIVMPPNTEASHGRAEIAKAFGGMTSGMKFSGTKLTTTDLIVSGDYAMETGTYEMTVTPKGAKAVKDVGKYETVWKKQPDGSWKLIRDIWNSDNPMK